MRINKFIAQSGLASRRSADELILEGKVTVNDKVVTQLGFWIRKKDVVKVEGKIVMPLEVKYYRFFKPAGYITTSNDEKGRKTIYDLIPKELSALKPVGRLDKDSSGLIILTNDGELINLLTHPSIKVPKVYRVTVDKKVNMEHLMQLAKGIEIEKGKLAYADSEILESKSSETLLEITLYQGLNRQIRKMFEHLGMNVIHLKRIKHATISLYGLKKGEIKPIKSRQIKELRMYLEKLYKGAKC